jgi:biotin carboxyl carrier protein
MRSLFLVDGIEHEVWLSRRALGFALHLGEAEPQPAALSPPEHGRTVLRLGATESGATIAAQGDRLFIHLDGVTYEATYRDPVAHFGAAAAAGAGDVAKAPMPGSVVAAPVVVGQQVVAGETLLVIESMKLELSITAERDGVVLAVNVAVGQTFERDAVLVALEPLAEA